uniref:Fucosyltransferase N-terminal domain-containing protein n=1 Tax=Plectus sambesii TaxID=2011161 RepID=A0A914UZ56_9BILA
MLAMRRRSSRVFLFLSLLGLFLIVLILLNAPAFEDVAAKKGLSFEREVQSDSAAPNGKRKKVLLMWTSVFGLKTANLDDCPLKDYCTLTFDHNLVEDADAVLFHMDPSEFDWALIPRLRHIHQRYIFLLQEAPHLDYQFDSNVVP